MQASALTATPLFLSAPGAVMASTSTPQEGKEIYEMQVYHFNNGGDRSSCERYLTEALIPYMNKNGVKVGAFGEYSRNEPPVVYLVLVYPSHPDWHRIRKAMWQDQSFMAASQTYFRDTAERGLYTRYESYLLEAFNTIPRYRQPDASRGLIELRIYESHNEEAGQRKIRMFNDEEIALFDQMGLHCLLFGEVIAGPQMPALAYMLWFEDMNEREANWKRFAESAEWKHMREKPEYAHTVSRVNRIFLVPLAYSQL